MKVYTYTEKVDLLWEAFVKSQNAVELSLKAKELGINVSTLRAQEKYAPILQGPELQEAKERWPRGRYVTSQMYSMLLKIDNEEERALQARRHCYWLNQFKFIFFDQTKRAYTCVLEGDALG